MSYKLTNEEVEQLRVLMDTNRVLVEDIPLEAPVRSSKPLLRRGEEALPLEHEAASESFLVAEMEGRCKLSEETRRREEKRLAKRRRERKPYSRKAKGRYHHKSKAATLRRRRKKEWEKNPLGALYGSIRQGVMIREDEWQRLVQPVWAQRPTGTLRVKNAGRGPLTVYTLMLVDEEGRVVYSGPNQEVLDVQDSRYVSRVKELQKLGNKKGP